MSETLIPHGEEGREEQLRRLIWKTPTEPNLRFYLALILIDTERWHEAETWLREELERFPTSANANHALGYCLVHRGDLAEAADILARVALAEVSTGPRFYVIKASVFRRLERLEEARDAYFEAIAAEPRCLLAHRGLCELSCLRGLELERPAGFALPNKNQLMRYDGFLIPERESLDEVIGWTPAPSVCRVRLFRKQVLVVSCILENEGTGVSLVIESLAQILIERWKLPPNVTWIVHHEQGVSGHQEFARVTFASTPPTAQPELTRFEHIDHTEVEALTGFRFVWPGKAP